MGREFELKYRASTAQLDAIRLDHGDFREITMETTYFDTPERSLASRRWTLRTRKENDETVCTLKTPSPDGGRNEWEIPAGDIQAGIPRLCELGAPEELKDLTAQGLVSVCGARFIRQAAVIELADCTVELALDRGILRGGSRIQLLREVEVELKSGSETAAVAFARGLAVKYGLRTEPASKYSRALALSQKI